MLDRNVRERILYLRFKAAPQKSKPYHAFCQYVENPGLNPNLHMVGPLQALPSHPNQCNHQNERFFHRCRGNLVVCSIMPQRCPSWSGQNQIHQQLASQNDSVQIQIHTEKSTYESHIDFTSRLLRDTCVKPLRFLVLRFWILVACELGASAVALARRHTTVVATRSIGLTGVTLMKRGVKGAMVPMQIPLHGLVITVIVVVVMIMSVSVRAAMAADWPPPLPDQAKALATLQTALGGNDWYKKVTFRMHWVRLLGSRATRY